MVDNSPSWKVLSLLCVSFSHIIYGSPDLTFNLHSDSFFNSKSHTRHSPHTDQLHSLGTSLFSVTEEERMLLTKNCLLHFLHDSESFLVLLKKEQCSPLFEGTFIDFGFSFSQSNSICICILTISTWPLGLVVRVHFM